LFTSDYHYARADYNNFNNYCSSDNHNKHVDNNSGSNYNDHVYFDDNFDYC
jgi:hypothetical protein